MRWWLRPRSKIPTNEETFDHPTRERLGSDPGMPAALRVRFRHGDSWLSGRVRNLSLSAVAISTGSPPRQGEVVEIELVVAEIEISVMARVVGVTPPEAAQLLGAFGFGARFVEQDAYVRHRLRQLWLRANEVGAFAESPPARRHPRYPVRWPVLANIDDCQVRLTALDISERGMFMASPSPPPIGAIISLTLPPEVDGSPLRALAHVTRVLDGVTATAHDLPSGFGLEIISMDHLVATAFHDLVARVERRAGRRVLVAARAPELGRISVALQSVGYVVHGVSSRAGLTDRDSLHAGLPDLVVVDAALGEEAADLLEAIDRAWCFRRPPMIRVNGAGMVVLKAVDSILQVR